MATTSQPRFTLLVANFSRPTPSSITGSDPNTDGPTKTRAGFVFGHLGLQGLSNNLTPTSAAKSVMVSTTNVAINPFETNPPTRPTGDLTVVNNTFAPGSVTIVVGAYELVAYRDWVPGGGVAATAAAIASAINTMNAGFLAVVAGPTVAVSGPLGSAPATVPFGARYHTLTANFTFAYIGTSGFLNYIDSPLFVGILPPSPINYIAP